VRNLAVSRNYRVNMNKHSERSVQDIHSLTSDTVTGNQSRIRKRSRPHRSFAARIAIADAFYSRDISSRWFRTHISSEEISDSPGGSWTKETREEERAGVRPREPHCAAKFQPADRQAMQTRAMDEMLTRRETIDYSCRDRNRQVGREMVFGITSLDVAWNAFIPRIE